MMAKKKITKRLCLTLLSFILTLSIYGCAGGSSSIDKKEDDRPLRLHPVSFQDLPGWEEEDFNLFSDAYSKSCQRILKRDSTQKFGPDNRWGFYQNWQSICQKFLKIDNRSVQNLRSFFEQNFQPHSILSGSDPKGLFTGYYEASLNGSKNQRGSYQYPLHARPDDLVMVDLGAFREDLKGRRIAGRVKNGRLRPYESRKEIVAGGLPKTQEKVLVWVDDPIDAFFVQIQGSGVVDLDNGEMMRIGYAGQNGHPYYAIGRELVKRGELKKKEVSLQSIRAWLKKHPDQASEIMNTNASYVFFRELSNNDGPKGGEGVSLTPGRSLAIDHSRMPYGLPLWLDVEHPDSQQPHIRRLVVAQDTGGAIRGAVRGDYFWGYGSEAENAAGQMKSNGRYWVLLPTYQSQ